MNRKFLRTLLISLLCFLGIGALFGGLVLIISPSGALFRMPIMLLENSPFHSFEIPGILLFVVLGVAPLFTAWGLLKRPTVKWAQQLNFFPDMHWAWSWCIYSVFALIIWLQVETAYIQSVHWSHSFYMLLAVAIIFVALLPKVRVHYVHKLLDEKLNDFAIPANTPAELAR